MTQQVQLDRAPGDGGGPRGSPAAVARGGRRSAAGVAGGTAAAATASQELSTSGRTPGASRAGTKYPVRGNPSLRLNISSGSKYFGGKPIGLLELVKGRI